MNDRDRALAQAIWPQHMSELQNSDGYNPQDAMNVRPKTPLEIRREKALKWLDDRWLLATPIEKRKVRYYG